MADKKVEKVEEIQVEKEKKEIEEVDGKEEEDDAKSDTQEKVENGDAQESEENGKVDDETEKVESEESEEKTCNVKRKSSGGDVTDGTPVEGVTPEKKQKLDEKASETEIKEKVTA